MSDRVISKYTWAAVRRVARSMTWCAAIYGAIAMMTLKMINFGVDEATGITHVELPLSQLGGIAVDRQGYIYVGSDWYHRIQVYTPGGAFIKGIAFDEMAGGYDFRINENDELELQSRGTTYVFDGGWKMQNDVAPFANSRSVRLNGATLQVAALSSLLPRIIRVSANEEQEVVVSQPWYLWLTGAPVPAFWLTIAGMAGLGILEGSRPQRQPKLQPRSGVCY